MRTWKTTRRGGYPWRHGEGTGTEWKKGQTHPGIEKPGKRPVQIAIEHLIYISIDFSLVLFASSFYQLGSIWFFLSKLDCASSKI